MTYIDGFVIPVPRGNREPYLAMATRTAEIFRRNGALRVVEAWGDDVPDGKVTDFRRSVQAADGEVVVFAWIEWPSREARNEGMRLSMEQMPEGLMDTMPFDAKRMIFGGFRSIMDL